MLIYNAAFRKKQNIARQKAVLTFLDALKTIRHPCNLRLLMM